MRDGHSDDNQALHDVHWQVTESGLGDCLRPGLYSID